MNRLARMLQDSLRGENFSNNIHDTLDRASSRDSTAGLQNEYADLGMASPFPGGRL